jgi:hypothetical protein
MAKSSQPFIIPTEEEVAEYMKKYSKEKELNWPEDFCKYYAEKFWNAYNSSGWRLSAGKGGLIKSWESCFKNNWKTLKYIEDITMLKACQPKPKIIDHDTLEYLDEILSEYRSNKESMTPERLASCYVRIHGWEYHNV